MPTYDYKCQACGHQFEQFQSMTAAPLRKCPECGKQKLERLIGTGAAVLFKGSGFYQTDYRSDSYQKAAKAESDSAKPKPAGDAGSKPAPAETPKAPAAAPAKSEAAAKPAKKARKD